MRKITRRAWLKSSAGLLAGGLLSSVSYAKRSPTFSPTPAEAEGPFYPLQAQKDTDFDLTNVQGASGVAQGSVIFIEGQVIDRYGKPIENAKVELWQANAKGRYAHPYDANPAPVDPNFQGWAIVPSGAEGKFRFKTIFPGAYPASRNWLRPPHIHFKISKAGYRELVTQMYFPEQELNQADFLLASKSQQEQALMIAARDADKPDVFRYRVVLAETV